MELPFVWIFKKGESGPLWGTDDGRHRERAAPVSGSLGATPAVQRIKARPRGTYPINQGSHLGT
ncbi:hypothetical protein GCM10011579_031440 [Streptomyces albiflavescens]|uniref:Uncharacterized protein n=1 Tax=Streptomyces albiflavescens TaxID=1623582 RepID=A0A917Y282_9ACTN|nr:hypothetical protein GCM10011579_031440 [Streptomyces albiflavescens]